MAAVQQVERQFVVDLFFVESADMALVDQQADAPKGSPFYSAGDFNCYSRAASQRLETVLLQNQALADGSDAAVAQQHLSAGAVAPVFGRQGAVGLAAYRSEERRVGKAWRARR